MSAFALDGNDLAVKNFSGFDLPSDVTVVGVLGDGSSAFNAVLQSPGTKLPEAKLDGRTTDAGLIAALRALRASEAQVTFVEPNGSHNVVVTQFSAPTNVPAPFLFSWSMTLVELP